jgi:hypothetical protein
MKRLVVIIFVILLVLAVPLSVYLVMKNEDLRKIAAPATTLKFSPQSVNKKVDDEFTLNALIDTANNQVVAAEINVAYDPTKVQALAISNGTLFPNILSSGTIADGLASISVGAANTTTPIHGAGVAISIKFKALSATTTPISIRFDANTYIGALGEHSANVLTTSIPATVTITDNQTADATPTPTLGLIQSPTITPKTQLTPTSSPTPSPIQTPIPTIPVTSTPIPVTITPTGVPLLITAPSTNESLTTNTPTIAGQAPAGTTVTITIYSDPITVTVVSDASGNWSYTLPEPLASGPHTVVAAAIDPTNGQTQSATLPFVVAAGSDTEDTATASAIPATGVNVPLFISLGFGILLLTIGLLIPELIHY